MAEHKPPRPLARPLVCIVDDDISFREALEGWIGSLGYATASFGSAEEFLAAGWDDIHCLLLDIQMPGRSGLELQDELNAAGRVVPTVFITSHSEPSRRERALGGGALGVLSKPFDRDALLSIIDGIGARSG